MEEKTYYYKLLDAYEEEQVENLVLCTNKDAKEHLDFIIDEIWENRYNGEEELKKYKYNEEENEITIKGKTYVVPENYGELISFIYEYLEDNGINCWRLATPHIDETYYY